MTAVYLGSTQTLNPTHTKIRRAMTAQCNTSTECHWLKIDHSSKDTNIVDFLSIYKRSTFCLCPPGDDPARKAVFDSIVSGCIPVIFELNTLYNQYPWHMTEQQALDISVYVPGNSVRTGQLDFMSVLLAISPEVIRKKQEVLAVIAPRVQYAMPPPEYLFDKYDNTTWDPPFKDGVELTLDGMFKRAADIVNNRSTGIPHRLMSGSDWGREYNNVRVQVPNITQDRRDMQVEQDRLIKDHMHASTTIGINNKRGHNNNNNGMHGGGAHGNKGLGNSGNGIGGGHRKHGKSVIAGTGAGGGTGDTTPGAGSSGLEKPHMGNGNGIKHGNKHGNGMGGGGGNGGGGKANRAIPAMRPPGEEENANQLDAILQ